ncbi:MAG: FAD-dependent oxidoreductase [Tepidisphaeraceae bacterium]
MKQATTGTTQPIWTDTAPAPDFSPLTQETDADVCVVGAGIAGLTTAYLLSREGKSVVVLDQGTAGAGETGRTSAHLASAIDDLFIELERVHGQRGSHLAYASHAAAIDMIERIARDEAIDCDLARLDGYLFLAPSHKAELLDRELKAAHRAGFLEAHRVDDPGVPGAVPLGPCIRFPHQGRFHPMKFLNGLVRAIQRRGGRLFGHTHVNDVHGGDPTKSERCRATGDAGVGVNASAVVVATNVPSPINDWMGVYLKQAPYRTYLIALEIPAGSVKDALFWDTGDPYHYVRVQRKDDGREVLLVGGEDHKVGQTGEADAPFMRLETWAREHFPSVGRVTYRWSGQVQEPADGVAFIGRAPTAKPNVYVITGDSGMGLTHGTLGAMLVTDLIMGRRNEWEDLYMPTRRSLKAAGEFTRQTLNMVGQYAELVTPGEVKSEDQIRPGTGAVLRDGLKKVAVYRDEAGGVHKCSANCTHLGCIVQWNNVEKSWDCPCHGSRFAAEDGRPLIGPAVSPLAGVGAGQRQEA